MEVDKLTEHRCKEQVGSRASSDRSDRFIARQRRSVSDEDQAGRAKIVVTVSTPSGLDPTHDYCEVTFA